MSTLADIRKAADVWGGTFVDDTTPFAHFAATAKVVGIVTDYLCAGDPSDETAPIVGRIERWPNATPRAYRGDRIKGGQLLTGWADSTEAFALMVQA